VLVSVAATDDDVTISVEDSGVGIAPEEMDRLFRPFSKTSARGTRGERSTGLGLTIAHNIVQAHGGTIRVESEPGRGSTFHVVLPRD
ncbi:MAG: hybrid sensor histidine kinase/response regulator, partial [Deltaproteobacteria bacterium]|nr:hybrid sensor histidine kinase/response regulator [Deltaproteobacteria bacterium]